MKFLMYMWVVRGILLIAYNVKFSGSIYLFDLAYLNY